MTNPFNIRAHVDDRTRTAPLDWVIAEIRRLRAIEREVIAAHEMYRAAEDRAYTERRDGR